VFLHVSFVIIIALMPQLQGRRAWAGAAVAGDRVIVIGGTRNSKSEVATDTVEAYNTSGAAGWTILPPLNRRRGWLAAAAVEMDQSQGSGTRVFAVGGFDCQGASLAVSEALVLP
jgi:hypothetical protein